MKQLNQDRITNAWFFASRVHKDQKYPGENLPYLTHIGNVVLEVMAVANNLVNPELAIICAILHDTIEDSSITYEDILQEFGKDVADGVMALTKDSNFATKKEKMLDSIKRIKEQPKEVWIVKMADRIANLGKPPHYWSLEKKIAYQEEAKIIWQHLHEANSIIATRLKQKIENYVHYLKE